LFFNSILFNPQTATENQNENVFQNHFWKWNQHNKTLSMRKKVSPNFLFFHK
jgi:hypothetical protein